MDPIKLKIPQSPKTHNSRKDYKNQFIQRSKNRIEVDVDLNYKDKKISSNSEILSETVIPSLKVKYILGKNKNNWQIVDYISGN